MCVCVEIFNFLLHFVNIIVVIIINNTVVMHSSEYMQKGATWLLFYTPIHLINVEFIISWVGETRDVQSMISIWSWVELHWHPKLPTLVNWKWRWMKWNRHLEHKWMDMDRYTQPNTGKGVHIHSFSKYSGNASWYAHNGYVHVYITDRQDRTKRVSPDFQVYFISFLFPLQ